MSDVSQAKKDHYDRSQVVEIISSVLKKVEGHDDNTIQSVYDELLSLEKLIEKARRDISAAGSGDIKKKHIPSATDELDAVIEATEQATGTIMDACEAIETITTKSDNDDVAQGVQSEIAKIYEACSFQDITGQRINKVVSTMKEIEQKVEHLLRAISPAGVVEVCEKTAPNSEEGQGKPAPSDEDLLNGPQMPGESMSQEDIDKMLSEFD